jgi:hypothetical protein
MRRPFEHTLTPAEQRMISKGLLVMSALWAALTLVVVGSVTANHYRGIVTGGCGTLVDGSGAEKPRHSCLNESVYDPEWARARERRA